MVTQSRRRFVAARQPDAEQVCSLDAAGAAKRQESPQGFLDLATAQEQSENGALFRFEAKEGIWERMITFIDEEGECCPFFSFEQWEEGNEVLLRITRPEAATAS